MSTGRETSVSQIIFISIIILYICADYFIYYVHSFVELKKKGEKNYNFIIFEII